MPIKRLRPPPIRLYRSLLHIIPGFSVIWFIKTFLKPGRVKESDMVVFRLIPGYKLQLHKTWFRVLLKFIPIRYSAHVNLSKASISPLHPICLHIPIIQTQTRDINLIPRQETQLIMDNRQERFIIPVAISRPGPTPQPNLMHITGKICSSNLVLGRMSTRMLCLPPFQLTFLPQCRIIWKILIANTLSINNNILIIKSYNRKDNYITPCTLRVMAISQAY